MDEVIRPEGSGCCMYCFRADIINCWKGGKTNGKGHYYRSKKVEG